MVKGKGETQRRTPGFCRAEVRRQGRLRGAGLPRVAWPRLGAPQAGPLPGPEPPPSPRALGPPRPGEQFSGRGPSGGVQHPTSSSSSQPRAPRLEGSRPGPPPPVPPSGLDPETEESASLIGLEHKRRRAVPETRSLIGLETNSRARNKEAFRHWATV